MITKLVPHTAVTSTANKKWENGSERDTDGHMKKESEVCGCRLRALYEIWSPVARAGLPSQKPPLVIACPFVSGDLRLGPGDGFFDVGGIQALRIRQRAAEIRQIGQIVCRPLFGIGRGN